MNCSRRSGTCRKKELTKNGNFRLLAAHGKRKRQSFIYTYMLSVQTENGKRKTEDQAIFPNPFAHRANRSWSFVHLLTNKHMHFDSTDSGREKGFDIDNCTYIYVLSMIFSSS